MTEKIIIAGAGGQGIMLLGKVLAEAAMREDKYVTWLPVYGAEVRGGTAYCMVIVSDRQIGSPYVSEADTLIIMNEPSLKKFKSKMKKGGLLIVNSSLVKGRFKKIGPLLKFPLTEIAAKLGNLQVANIIALGSYLAKKKIVNSQSVYRAIEKIAPESKRALIVINQQALQKGRDLADGKS